MPNGADIASLEAAADLLRDAHALYEGVLPYLTDDLRREEMRGVIAVRGALHLRLRDHLAELGHAGAGRIADRQNDVACLGIHRLLSQGDTDGALQALASWDSRLRDRVAQRLQDAGLRPIAKAHLNFTMEMLEAMPVAPGTDVAPEPLRRPG